MNRKIDYKLISNVPEAKSSGCPDKVRPTDRQSIPSISEKPLNTHKAPYKSPNACQAPKAEIGFPNFGGVLV